LQPHRPMTKPKRKGAKSIKHISKDILDSLNRGEMETANLVEWLAIDQRALISHLLKRYNREIYLKPIVQGLDLVKKPSILKIHEALGRGLLQQATLHQDQELWEILSKHPSDAVRCWVPYCLGQDASLSLDQRFDRIQAFAADPHFGVRELAWLGLRKNIAQTLNQSLTILSTWTQSPDPNLRRFASESTRPRGVWCQHLLPLKENPALGLKIIEPLKSDPSPYVQDSVANWLNDASKSKPEFVLQICKDWERQSNTPQTQYILRKALRTLRKKGH
jgi:3-methyladenine DNA glycosylase AlkC